MNIKQKDTIISMIENDNTMSAELKESFKKQILAMNAGEFSVFLESMKGVENENDVKEKISQLQQMEKIGHNDFLQTANKFSRKITQHEAERQENDDTSKADALLNKIKSL